jgi:UDP-N-acetylmuramate dehydrogenase
MRVLENPSLRALNTFGISATAALLLVIESEEDVLSSPALDPSCDLVLGGGSNLVFASDVPGTVFHNQILGAQIVEEQPDYALLEVGAGESWHELVRWTLEHGLSGLENLSLIPGCAGAAPIQNIGAYGVELSEVLEGVTAWDWRRSTWTAFSREDCRFAYRDSLFKSAEPDRYLITSIRLRLNKNFAPRLDYAGLREELSAAGIREPSALDVSNVVMRIRQRRLPDPANLGNAGSFFKNPVVTNTEAETLRHRYPDLPSWPSGQDRVKLSAAWMVDHCGLKGMRSGDAAVSEQHALVLVNHGSASGAQIVALARNIQSIVEEAFGVTLEPEPRLVEFDT